MLDTRLDRLGETTPDSEVAVSEDPAIENPIRDLDYGFEGDNTPTQVLEQNDWHEHQRRQLKTFAERLEKLGNIHTVDHLY